MSKMSQITLRVPCHKKPLISTRLA
jgi:hypothetical protein